MEVRTHWLGGLAAGAVTVSVLHFTSPLPLMVFLGTAMLAGPLPDLDHPGSTYGRFVPLPPVAEVHGRVVAYQGHQQAHFGRVGFRTPFGISWHRGGYHSVVAGLLTAAVVGAITHWVAPAYTLTVALAVLVGFLSHIILDGFNMMGQALWWPLTLRRYHLAWPRFRVGSAGEALLTVALLGGLAWWGGRDEQLLLRQLAAALPVHAASEGYTSIAGPAATLVQLSYVRERGVAPDEVVACLRNPDTTYPDGRGHRNFIKGRLRVVATEDGENVSASTSLRGTMGMGCHATNPTGRVPRTSTRPTKCCWCSSALDAASDSWGPPAPSAYASTGPTPPTSRLFP